MSDFKGTEIDRRDRDGVINDVLNGIPTDVLVDEGLDQWSLRLATHPYNLSKDVILPDSDRLNYFNTFYPAIGTDNNRLVIYAHGHETNIWDGTQSRAKTNIDIMRNAMPDYNFMECFSHAHTQADGPASNVIVNGPNVSSNLVGHNILLHSFPDELMRRFMWHYYATVNTFIGTYDRIFMTGLSGGALQSLWMGAFDTRIDGVFPMAGFQPDWVWESDDPLSAGPGDGEQSYGPHIIRTSRVGMMALAAEKWCHVFWNSNDTVQPLDQANTDLTISEVRSVSGIGTKFNATLTAGATDHVIEPSWPPIMLAEMDAL